MMLYSNTKAKFLSPDGDTDFFDVGILQGGTLAPYLFIICLDYVLRTSIDLIKENGFTLKKKKKGKEQTISRTNYYGRRLYLAQTIMDADYSASGKYMYRSRIPAA